MDKRRKRIRRIRLESLEPRHLLAGSVVFNELQYNPAPMQSTGEWIEIHNQFALDVDLSEWTIEGGVQYSFPAGTTIGRGEYLVVAADPVAVQAEFGLGGVFGPFAGDLSNGGETLRLLNRNERLIDELSYADNAPWPVTADGSGATLAKLHSQQGSNLANNWRGSESILGTPGEVNFPSYSLCGADCDSQEFPWEVQVPVDAEWSYRETLPANDWQAVSFDDSQWTQADGPLEAGGNFIDYSSGETPGGSVVSSLPILNSSFEFPQTAFGGGGNFYSDVPQWNDPVGGPAGVASVTNHTSVWFNGLTPVEGDQIGFIQGGGSFRQTISGLTPGEDYVVKYWENERGLAVGGFSQTRVLANGQEIVATHQVIRGDWLNIVSQPFTAVSSNVEVVFEHVGGVGDNTSFYDVVQLLPAEETIANGGFETPDLSPDQFQYAPTNASWSFNSAGVAHNASGFMNGGVTAPIGDQIAFLQGAGSIEQTLSNLEPGATYSVSWYQQTRLCCSAPNGNDLVVTLASANETITLHDSWVVNSDWRRMETDFQAIDSTYSMRFESTDALSQLHGGGDRTVLLDEIRVEKINEPLNFNSSLNAANGTTYFRHQFDWSNVGDHEVAVNLLADDGAIVYVNGQEALRVNMPAGPIDHATFSVQPVAAPAFSGPLSIDASLLIEGENTIAVELHRSTAGDTDLAWGLEVLSRRMSQSANSIDSLILNEVGAAGSASFFVEVMNVGSDSVDLAAFQIASSRGDSFTLPTQDLAPNSAISFDAAALGFGLAFDNNDRIFLLSDDRVVDGVNLSSRVQARDDSLSSWFNVEVSSPGGNNTITVGDSVVLNEIYYHAQPSFADGNAIFTESNEEWIELYNRGQGVVSLDGYQLDGDVSFQFPEGASIGVGEYLVVAWDAIEFAAKYPATDVVGPFGGKLSNRDGEVFLLDPLGNPVDEVRYFDGGYWPTKADGGGSSLELRNANSDNSLSTNWDASDETSRSSWQTYQYRMTGGEPAGNNNPSVFEEFIVGLLNRGELLIDDVQLIQDPTGAATNLIQNGSFESDVLDAPPVAWRALGTHRESRVVVDPDDVSNQAFLIDASDATEHMHNHLETTLAGGAQILAGVEYDVVFNAKWISGSPQLNTRAYFNQLAATTIVDTPSLAGTPGGPNSTVVANVGPDLRQLRHSPLVPTSTDDVTIAIAADDVDGVGTVTLHYEFEGVAFTESMALSDGSYRATIPALVDGTTVRFYVEAEDSHGVKSFFPPTGPESHAMYRVDGDGALDVDSHSIRLIMTEADVDWMHREENVMSNHRIGSTVIYNDSEIYYDVGVRLRASGYGRRGARVGFSFQFHPDHLFRDTFQTVVIDRGTVLSNGDATGVQGVAGASPHELLFHQIANRAGGITGNLDDLVFLDAPRNQNTGFGQLKMERYSDEYLSSQFANGDEGDLYKYELIYFADSTIDGNPESMKRSPNNVLGVDISDMGDQKEPYRWNYLKKNRRAVDDYSRVIDLAQLFSLPSHQLEPELYDVIDVDQWMRTFALLSLTGIADTYNMGSIHNLDLYVRPEDNRVLALPWDLDHGFFHRTDSPMLGIGNTNLSKIINLPSNRRLFHGHLLDLIQTSYNNSYLGPWIDHYADRTGFDLSTFFRDYVQARGDFVLQALNGAAPVVPFEISSNGGEDFGVVDSSVVLQGTGWIDVHEIQLAGALAPLQVNWLDSQTWQIELPLSFGVNMLEFQAFDFQGQLVGNDSINIDSSAVGSGVFENLRITELMYHPSAPTTAELLAGVSDSDEFEYIELLNTGDTAINLNGVQFVSGIDFTFGDVDLAAGEYLLIVENQAAFEIRYGSQLNVVGQWTGGLSNNSETVSMLDQDGRAIHQFTYDDSGDWPGRADGFGSSLDVVLTTGEYQLPSNWRSSSEYDGSPGAAGQGIVIDVVVNEVLAHTDLPLLDTIEIFNTTNADINVGGWYLSDDRDNYRKFQIPANTILGSHEYLLFDETDFNLSMGANPNDFAFSSSRGDDVWLLAADAQDQLTRFVDHVEFGATENGVSVGRFPNGTGVFAPLETFTLGDFNAAPKIGSLVISEVMYQPQPAGVFSSNDLEYVEVFNRSGSEVELLNWQLRGGADFDFAAGETLASGEYLVIVAFDPEDPLNADLLAAFQSNYLIDGSVGLVGPLNDPLNNSGETLRLLRPDSPPLDDPSFIPHILEDEIAYTNTLPWPTEPAGQGASLARSLPQQWGAFASSWEADGPSPGSGGAAPQVVSVTLNESQADPVDLAKGVQPTSWQQQRSLWTSLQIVFDEPIALSVDDLVLTNLGVNAVTDPNEVIDLSGIQLDVAGNVVTLQFPVNHITDGVYQLEVLATATDGLGNSLDGNADGIGGDSYSYIGDVDNRFYRLISEFNGDGGVSVFDFSTFSYWFGNAVPTAPKYVDMNDDGGVSVFDFTMFSQKFGIGISYPVGFSEDTFFAFRDSPLVRDFTAAVEDLPEGEQVIKRIAIEQLQVVRRRIGIEPLQGIGDDESLDEIIQLIAEGVPAARAWFDGLID
jgi:hypothetical protein